MSYKGDPGHDSGIRLNNMSGLIENGSVGGS
jgi:hypothetical protein